MNQCADLFIGQCHTAACPVGLLMYQQAAITQTVDADIAAQRGADWWLFASQLRLFDGCVIAWLELAFACCLVGMLQCRVVKCDKNAVTRVVENRRNLVVASGRGVVATPVQV